MKKLADTPKEKRIYPFDTLTMAKKSKPSSSKKTTSSRPKPLVPRAGFRVDGLRYGKGGKICK